ncbi:hypothetical protein JOD02_000710 [Caldicoprobacter guelmensis]|uniref:DUF3360 family protein n=1 Tax=Caldicoprobacter guelmensis TaxID=1170224 RepID=UPI001958C438|nr:DUF3360 family protein [Caldicoprobacter guelmensis]MBM7581873.1 hypothetical protein [Caldicoprobacter guelmensis]
MSECLTRQERLNKDLISYNPKRWRVNIPFKDYSLRIEDIVPALSGAIGKVALVAAFAVAWAQGFGIKDPAFVIENVRLEIVVASILTIIFCAFLNPYAGPPGTLAPLIPLVPAMVASGVHPLPLSILIGFIGIIISGFKYFDKVIALNGPGTRGGIILLFGIMGISSSLDNLKNWAHNNGVSELVVILLIVCLILYLLLNKFRLKWLIIPTCALAALLMSGLYGKYPAFETSMAFPIMNPNIWWNEKWGIGWGINLENFIKALPFTMLAVVMWPLDALAVKTIQELNYPREAKKAVFDMNSTYTLVSIRNIIGAVLGGGQISAVWRSFMIPLGVVRRPIGGSALILGIMGLAFGFFGVPIDIAVFPPLLWVVLIFGVFMPLLEIGLNTVKSIATAQIASICLITGFAINPVLGWVAANLVENFKIIDATENNMKLSRSDKVMTIVIATATIVSYILANVF